MVETYPIPPADHRAGNVHPSDGAAPVSESGDLFPVQGHSQGRQFFQHLPGAMEPGNPHRCQRLVQRPVPRVYIQSQNVEISDRPVGTDFHPRDNLQTGTFGSRSRFGKPC